MMLNAYNKFRSSHCGAVETNPTRNHEIADSNPGLAQWVKDLALPELYCRPAATAPTGPLAWEPPYAMSAALKRRKTKKKKKKKKSAKLVVPILAQRVKDWM